MSWYLIVLLIIFYIVMWSITTIILTRLAKSSNSELWIPFGAIWPLVLMCVPLVAVILLVEEVVDKYGYKEE